MKKEKKLIKVLIKRYFDFPWEAHTIEEGAKMFGIQRISSVYVVDDTVENRKLAIEHNAVLSEMDKLKDKIKELSNQMKKVLK